MIPVKMKVTNKIASGISKRSIMIINFIIINIRSLMQFSKSVI